MGGPPQPGRVFGEVAQAAALEHAVAGDLRLLEDVVRAHEQTRAGVELAVSAEVG